MYIYRRPLTSTTPSTYYSSDSYVHSSTTSTSRPITTVSHVSTPVPSLHAAKSISDHKLSVAIPLATLRVTMETSSIASNQKDHQHQIRNDDEEQQQQQELNQTEDDQKISEESTRVSEESTKINEDELNHVEENTPNETDDSIDTDNISEKIEETTSVEQRLKKISEEIEKYSNGNDNSDNHGRKSFFSITDLFNTLRPADKKIIPQIDSDYSNTMHVLGETASIVSGDDARKIKTIDLRQTNRALY